MDENRLRRYVSTGVQLAAISKETGLKMGACYVLASSLCASKVDDDQVRFIKKNGSGTGRALIKGKNIVLHSTNSKDQNR